VFLGSRKGIGLEVVGIVSALLVLLIWFGVSSASNSYPREYGTSWSNFLNWVGSSQAKIFGVFLVGGMLLVLLLSVTSIGMKRLGARRKPLADDGIEPLAGEIEDEQK